MHKSPEGDPESTRGSVRPSRPFVETRPRPGGGGTGRQVPLQQRPDPRRSGGLANGKPDVGSAMKHFLEASVRIALFVFILLLWWWVLKQSFSGTVNLSIIVGGVLLVFPIVWFGRTMLDRKPTMIRVAWITHIVHYTVLILLGVSVFRAVVTHQDWSGWTLPVPTEIGLILTVTSGAAALLTVVNLAVKGLGAPFAVALSRKVATDWSYAWTRNPMVLATLVFFFSLGIWFQSALFLLWVLMLVAPALVFIVRVYEERELELRFGAPYLEYKSRTPMLLPRKPED